MTKFSWSVMLLLWWVSMLWYISRFCHFGSCVGGRLCVGANVCSVHLFPKTMLLWIVCIFSCFLVIFVAWVTVEHGFSIRRSTVKSSTASLCFVSRKIFHSHCFIRLIWQMSTRLEHTIDGCLFNPSSSSEKIPLRNQRILRNNSHLLNRDWQQLTAIVVWKLDADKFPTFFSNTLRT